MKTGRALLAALILGAGVAMAADYGQWRGPKRDGIAAEKGLLKSWPASGPKLLWQRKDIGYGYGSPAAVGKRLYLLGSEGVESEFVRCLEVASGKTLWTTKLGKVGNPNQQPSYPGARSTPTIDGRRLYALSSDGDLACLETASGKILWKKSLRSDFGGTPGIWAYSESPLVDGNRVVVAPGGDKATIVALDKSTGALLWSCRTSEGERAAAYGSSVVSTAGGVRQYVHFLPRGVVGVDARTGVVLWRYNGTVDPRFGVSAQTPVTEGDRVYTAAGNAGGQVEIKAAGGTFEASEVWKVRDLPCGLGGTLLAGGRLYGANNRELVCADWKSGKILWSDRSVGPASVCLADGLLYVHGESGEVALVEATDAGYRERGRFTPPERPEHLRGAMEKSWAYPVVSDGKLYLRDGATLWCYDVKGK